MNYKKSLLVFCLIICVLISVSSAAAGDVNDTAILSEDDSQIELAQDPIGDDPIELGDEDIKTNENNETTFTALNTVVNGNSDADVYLKNNYEYKKGSDSFTNGIVISRSVTIHGNGSTIDAKNTARIFSVTSGTVVFKDIIFTNAKTTGNGGAILANKNAAITLNNCTFISNNAKLGGAVYADGKFNCVNCIFNKNQATEEGGALNVAQGTIDKCTFSNNVAEAAGAVSMGTGTVKNSKFNSNTAKELSSGALFIDEKGTVKNCEFKGNKAESRGGAISFGSFMRLDETLSSNVENCKFVSNVASLYGGAVCGGTCKKCTFSGNKAKFGSATYESKVFPYPKKITVSSVKTTYNVKKKLVIKLTDSNGKAVSGYNLEIEIDGEVKNVKTNSKGKATYTIDKLVPRKYELYIVGASKNKHVWRVEAFTSVFVKKASPKITVKAKSFKKSTKTKKYTVTLKNNVKKVMKNKKVTLKIKGKKYTAKTNSKGKATFKIKNLKKKGKFTATVAYKGDKYYKKVTKKVKLTVK